MKAFQFRLDPALRWRCTQLELERQAVSRAAGHVAALRTELNAVHLELRSASADLASVGSSAFQSWAAYVDRRRRGIRGLEDQLRQASAALANETRKMGEAHRKVRVLQNLERDRRAEWSAELDRETEAFAAEAWLARLQSKSGRVNTGGARSSSG